MKRILCSHWLPERARWAYRSRSGFPALVPHARESFLFRHIINSSLTMLVRSTIGLFQFCDFIELDLFSVHKNAEKNLANIQQSWSHAPGLAIRELKQRRRRKCSGFILAKQQLCTWITLFCTFLSRRCTTTTWKCLISRFVENRNTRQQLPFSFLELLYSPLEFNSKTNCQHLTN